MNYQETVDYIESIPGFTKKNPVEHTKEMLRRLGNPEESFRVIHVAGSNGKGSVCAFLSSILSEAGQKTGLFTSPHLVKINERFQIDRVIVSDDELTESFRIVKEVIDGMAGDGLAHPTYFETLFAMGMVIFQRAGIDTLVMETGMGGLRDATNAVASPVCCVITSISLDHTEFLGNTIAEIAGQKAGIIKEGVPVVYDAGNREAAEVIKAQADKMHASALPFYMGMADVLHRSDKSIDFVLNNRYYDNTVVSVPFPAEYQIANSCLAMMAARAADPSRLIRTETIVRAVSKTRWAGRMEEVMPDVFIDGAHNEDGIAQFLDTVCRIQQRVPVSLLFAAVTEKNYEDMIREICDKASFENITVTQVGGHRKVDPEKFAQIFRECTDAPVSCEEDVRKAFAAALASKPAGGILFCAGSLYLVGEIKEYLEQLN